MSIFYCCPSLVSFIWSPFGAPRNHRAVPCFPGLKTDDLTEEQTKMANQEEFVREFVAVTDVDEERARFFLESSGWNLQVRVSRGSRSSHGGDVGVQSGDKSCGESAGVKELLARRLPLARVAGNLCKSPFDNGPTAICRRRNNSCTLIFVKTRSFPHHLTLFFILNPGEI